MAFCLSITLGFCHQSMTLLTRALLRLRPKSANFSIIESIYDVVDISVYLTFEAWRSQPWLLLLAGVDAVCINKRQTLLTRYPHYIITEYKEISLDNRELSY